MPVHLNAPMTNFDKGTIRHDLITLQLRAGQGRMVVALTGGAVQVGGHGNLPQPLLVQERGEELVGVAETGRLDQVDVRGKAGAPAAQATLAESAA